MTMEEAIGFYHSLERFGINPGLERIKALCEMLGNPQKKFRAVHVAGTNGKGTTCTLIASALCKAGFRTGLYTSPYVIEFRERMRLNGEMIEPQRLVSVTERVKECTRLLNEKGIFPTEFEAVTAAAFEWYAQENCEIAVLETGLGGRYDATNIIENPLCSVITSISLDHVKILGNTLAEIAGEKCGIIKKGCPVVTSASQSAEALGVIKKTAAETGSPIRVAPDYKAFEVRRADITGTYGFYDSLELSVPFCGEHQIENAILSTETLRILSEEGIKISDKSISDGIAAARLPARTEIISKAPLIILDGSHNDGSTAALSGVLSRFLNGKRIIAVMGMMADKDCNKALDNLLPHFSKVITVTPSNPRAMKATDFSKIIKARGVEAEAYDLPANGIAEAFAELPAFDAMTVCGSLYLAADVREQLLHITER